ncbi:MAG: DUF305 domain-containing protein [Nanoarchaeota archaeon]|jgi:uncharacterized membrane protein|nr:DUF305 domain-containing protein [Nanoarchaeota archaeon]
MKFDNYSRLYFSLFISFIIMYSAMFLNVFAWSHIYLSLTRVYMALLMVMPMSILMILIMKKMYLDKKKNSIIIFIGVFIFILAFILLRSQIPINDESYMKAMIPHHSSAILTSTYANIRDPEVRVLADKIIETQEKEIAQMKYYLDRLSG